MYHATELPTGRLWAVTLAAVFLIVAADARRLPAQQQSEARDEEPLDERIDRLIEQLGDEDYTVRERAQKELAELGLEAYDALTAAAAHEDLEIAARARYLLLLIPARWSAENEPAEVRRYLTYYHSQSSEVRTQVLQVLGGLSNGIGVPALCRLVRFERSARWSKQAAVEILNSEPADRAGRARWREQLEQHLGRSGRTAARWLRDYLRFDDDPEAALDAWARLADLEQGVLKGTPDRSCPRIVAALLYHLAMAQSARGHQEAAERTIEQARQVGTSRSAARLDAHVDTAVALQRRGRFRWAEAEFRHVIGMGVPMFAAKAQVGLAEMLHDEGNDLAAAEALRNLVQMIDQKKVDPETAVRRTGGEVRARMSYFYACHWQEQGNRDKQREHLDEAIRQDPGDIDVLIARYQFPSPAPEFREKTLELIEKKAAEFRNEIARAPEEPGPYNQFAWLVGNTEGDLDEAQRCAEKAVELWPDSGAFLDTLAHVHFGRGDLQNAVKHQAKAAELDPHSGLIARKLRVFRDALEKKQENTQKQKTEAANPPQTGKKAPKAESSQPE